MAAIPILCMTFDMKRPETEMVSGLSYGLGERIRTSGLLNPIGCGFIPCPELLPIRTEIAMCESLFHKTAIWLTNLSTLRLKFVYSNSLSELLQDCSLYIKKITEQNYKV